MMVLMMALMMLMMMMMMMMMMLIIMMLVISMTTMMMIVLCCVFLLMLFSSWFFPSPFKVSEEYFQLLIVVPFDFISILPSISQEKDGETNKHRFRYLSLAVQGVFAVRRVRRLQVTKLYLGYVTLLLTLLCVTDITIKYRSWSSAIHKLVKQSVFSTMKYPSFLKGRAVGRSSTEIICACVFNITKSGGLFVDHSLSECTCHTLVIKGISSVWCVFHKAKRTLVCSWALFRAFTVHGRGARKYEHLCVNGAHLILQ